MGRFVLAALSLALLGLVQGDFPMNWDRDLRTEMTADISRNSDPGYRLPETIIPIDYDIDIEMFFEATEEKPAFSYDGRVIINVQVVAEDVTEIVVHENVDQILGVTVTEADGTPVLLNSQNSISEDPIYHFLKINLHSALVNGAYYVIRITYHSTMNNTPMRRGIWRGRYEDDDGTERFYASSHFQPYSARQAFPCFDEPALKAVFNLHLTKPASYSGTFSNMPILSSETLNGSRVRDTFYPTPRMSTYLLTFLVSEEITVLAESNELEIPVRIIGRPNAGEGSAQHSLDLAVPLTRYFEEFFGITYAMMNPNINNDHIASPDWASAGTENWGLVSYRELYLLHNVSETPMDTERYIASLISHEIVHSWFGNWATCEWWSNTWINEGYASYFGYLAVDRVEPKYELHDHFNWRYLQGSMAADSAASSPALNHEVNSPTEVTGHFGTISYSKGAALLRMIEDLITPDTFRKGNQYFLQYNAFEPADQYSMYEAFAQAVDEDGTTTHLENFNMYSFFQTWVDQSGFPIINVEVDHSTGDININQERFYLSPTATQTDEIWPVPITFTTQNDPNFDNVRADFLLTGRSDVLHKEPGEEWVLFNVKQHGIYRVNYDDQSWDLLEQALLNEPDTIHFLNRAQVVDDVFALMRSQRMTYLRGFNILRFLRQETNYHVWDPAIIGFTWLRNRLRHLPEQQAELDALVLSYMEHAIQHYGYDVVEGETTTETQARLILLAFACNVGHEGCVSDAQTKWQALRSGQWVSPHLRRHVFTVGIREGTLEDYQFLLDRMLASNTANDDYVMLRGLGASRDPSIITSFLELSLDTTVIRPHDSVNAFNMALLGNVDNVNTALQFVKDNIDQIRDVYTAEAQSRPVHTVFSNLASYLDEEGLIEFETWLHDTQSQTAEYSTGVSAAASARTNRAWGTQHADEIIRAVRNGAPALSASFVLLLAIGVYAIAA